MNSSSRIPTSSAVMSAAFFQMDASSSCTNIQIGMNPLSIALTADGKYLVTSNDDEREGGLRAI
jgi:hypothetical protein